MGGKAIVSRSTFEDSPAELAFYQLGAFALFLAFGFGVGFIVSFILSAGNASVAIGVGAFLGSLLAVWDLITSAWSAKHKEVALYIALVAIIFAIGIAA